LLGGYHLARQSDPAESIRIIRTGLDEGINFLDNCWDYNGGESEIRMGKALRDGYRQKAFLMTKWGRIHDGPMAGMSRYVGDLNSKSLIEINRFLALDS